MTELKFRVWIGYLREYHEVTELHFTHELVCYVEEFEGEYFECGSLVTEDVVIEQYTGFKDKNGKEVYVGDILKGDDGDYFYNHVFIDKETHRLMREDGIELYENIEQLEVVGTVHENPELLELIE